MSVSGSKTKQSASQQGTSSSTATSTPNVPSQFMQPWNDYAGSISALQNSGKPLISGASPLQQQAFSAASSLTGAPASSATKFDPTAPQTIPGAGGTAPAGQPMTASPSNSFDLATQLGLSGSKGGSAAQANNRDLTDVDMSGYFNPIEQRVIDTTLADYDVNSERQLAAQRGQQALNGGMRNSNNSIMQALLQGEQGRGRATTDANIRYEGYDRATGLAQTDLARETANNQANAALRQQRDIANQQAMLQGAGLFAGLGATQGADTRANIGLQADLGGQQRDIANSQSEAANLALIQQLLGGIPLSDLTGRTITENGSSTGSSKGSSSTMGMSADLSDLAKIMKMSDERLKEAIETEGYDAKGRRWVSWNYLWDKATRHFGVIAQEILGTDPQAVHVHPSGYLMVNYGALNG